MSRRVISENVPMNLMAKISGLPVASTGISTVPRGRLPVVLKVIIPVPPVIRGAMTMSLFGSGESAVPEELALGCAHAETAARPIAQREIRV